MTGTPDGRGEERLVRPEDLATLDGDARSGGTHGSAWPAATVALATVASWMAVALTFARTGIDPDLFAFHTANVPWVLVTVGAPATLTIAAGAAGMDPSHRFAAGLRRVAAAITAAQILVLAVIAVIQSVKDARATVMTETVLVSVTVLLAAAAIVLGFLGARDRGAAPSAGRLSVAGLVCVLLGQAVLAAATVAAQPGSVGIYVVSLLISTLTPLASLTALWLVCRTGRAVVRTGAVVLCVLAVVAVGSLINVFVLGLPGSSVPLQSAQVVLYAGAAAAAVMAARAAGRSG